MLLLSIGVVLGIRQQRLQRRAEDEKLAAVGHATARILHQLKNPLQTVILHTELLEDQSLQANPELQRETREAILSEAQRLADMLNELSLWASGVRRNLSLAPVALHELVAGVVRHHGREADPAGVQLEVGRLEQTVVGADVYYLQQAIENILRNAQDALYGRSDGWIRITVERTGEAAAIRIADNGSGIPPEKLGTIFEPFVSGKSKGMGLGLSISKEIIEGHGGRVEVQSQLGEGTEFTLVLPLHSGAEEDSPQLESSSAPLT